MPWKYNVGDTVKVAYPTYEHERTQGLHEKVGRVLAGPEKVLGRYEVFIPWIRDDLHKEPAAQDLNGFVIKDMLSFELEKVDADA